MDYTGSCSASFSLLPLSRSSSSAAFSALDRNTHSALESEMTEMRIHL